MSHASCACVNQDGLASPQIRALDQCLPYGNQHQRQRGAVMQINIGGLCSAIVFMQRGMFGIATRLIAYAAVAEIYRIADFEARYRAADFFHDARAIAAEYCGQLVRVIHGVCTQFACLSDSPRQRRVLRINSAAMAVRVFQFRALAAHRGCQLRSSVWLSLNLRLLLGVSYVKLCALFLRETRNYYFCEGGHVWKHTRHFVHGNFVRRIAWRGHRLRGGRLPAGNGVERSLYPA
jgi:hypothetical protein